MANTCRDSTTLQSYAQLTYKGHDATKDPARIGAQEWRDMIISHASYASAVFCSTTVHASTGSTEVYRLANLSTSYASNSSSDITVADSTNGLFTFATKGTYLVGFDADVQGDGDITFSLHSISTAGSTAQGATCKVHTLSTAEQHTGLSQIIDIAATKKVSVVWTATTAASTFFLTGTMYARRVK